MANNKRTPWNFFLADVKDGEVYHKLLGLEEYEYDAHTPGKLYVVDIGNRKSFGWDVFYLIHQSQPASDTVKLKMVDDIAEALIPEMGNNPYFHINGRKILSGVLFYYADKGLEFIPIIHRLMRSNFDELITEIVNTAKQDGNGIVLDKLQGFVGKGENESLQDIESTLKTYLDVFSYPDIEYLLYNNPHRTSPAVLDGGEISLDFAMQQRMFKLYSQIFRLVSIQVLRHAESFSESDDRYTALIFDEAAKIGKIEDLDLAMATLRNRHCALVLIYQALDQFRAIYKKETADVLFQLCELKIFLSGSGDKVTTEMLSSMAGEYIEQKESYEHSLTGGKKGTKYSEERRAIIDGKSMMSLRSRDELIAFIYGEYIRVKKFKYFTDRWLKPIADRIHKKEGDT